MKLFLAKIFNDDSKENKIAWLSLQLFLIISILITYLFSNNLLLLFVLESLSFIIVTTKLSLVLFRMTSSKLMFITISSLPYFSSAFLTQFKLFISTDYEYWIIDLFLISIPFLLHYFKYHFVYFKNSQWKSEVWFFDFGFDKHDSIFIEKEILKIKKAKKSNLKIALIWLLVTFQIAFLYLFKNLFTLKFYFWFSFSTMSLLALLVISINMKIFKRYIFYRNKVK